MAPTFRFVAGKGGVGKTTVAAARAVALAGEGRRVLAVSTDPAHSLADALDVESSTGTGFAARSGTGFALGPEPRPVALDVEGELLAAELAAGPAWERWLDPRREAFHALAERGSLLDADDAARLLGLPVPGVDELVGLLELVRLAETSGCEAVVVDTAPTAHTLRLLRMPEALERLAAVLAAFRDREREVAEALTGRRGGLLGDPADEVAAGVDAEARALGELIRDPARARFTWVLLPEALSLAESRDALAELERAGAAVDEVVVNRVTPPPPGPCRACAARRRAEAGVVREVRAAWPERPVVLVPELEGEPRGAEALRGLAGHLSPGRATDRGREGGAWDPEWEAGAEPSAADEAAAGAGRAEGRPPAEPPPTEPASPPSWLVDLAPPGLRLLLFGGKGGVGKTTCAAAAALLAARAEPGRPVLLLSTDPAHSLADVLDLPEGTLGDRPHDLPGAPANLQARELDAPAVFERWREEWREALDRALDRLGGAGSKRGLDAPLDRAVFERLLDATPPGLDELVALSELLHSLVDEEDGSALDSRAGILVVVDTAPTGHALRLLEMPELALRWDHALLALLLKYREAVGLPAEWAEELLELARRLKAFRALLSDPARCRFAAVTRAGELPRRETERLLGALGRLGVAAPILVVNAVPEGECARCRRAAERVRAELERLPPSSILTAPARYPPPRGVPTLERWGRSWRPEPRPMTKATYLYCLVRDPERPAAEDLPAAPPGVPGASPPRLLPVADDLWLVAADAPLPAYGEAEIAAHLEDLAWVSDRALAHEAVVEHFADPFGADGEPAPTRAIVPMKLFTLFASDDRAVAHVTDELPRVRQALDRVAGREEWGVRLRLDRARAAEAAAGGGDEPPASGRDFLARKKRLRDAAQKRPAEAREAALGAYAALAARAAEAVERPIEAPGSLILDAAFLVSRAERTAFEEAVAEQARELAAAHLDLTLTGPWPPYHFVGEAR